MVRRGEKKRRECARNTRTRVIHIDAALARARRTRTGMRACLSRACACAYTNTYVHSVASNSLTCNIVITRGEALSPRRFLYLLCTLCPCMDTYARARVTRLLVRSRERC